MLNEAKQPLIGHNFEVLPVADSSNNYAMEQIHDGKAVHGNAYLALRQTAGKGQRGKTWHSGIEENMALSLVLAPNGLHLNQQFLLNAFIAVGLVEFLQEITPGFKIKWPNDIYYHDRKAAGILIENNIQGNTWKFAVAGIGLNVNQTEFDASLPNAVSLQQITNSTTDLYHITQNLLLFYAKKWNDFIANPIAILEDYNTHLYKKNEPVRLKKGTAVYATTINRVNEYGILFCGADDLLEFQFGTVAWVLD